MALALVAALLAQPLAPEAVAIAAPGRHDYFVDCTADDRGTGARSDPWGSLASASEHGAFHPGDRILLRRGTTCRGHLVLTGSGTAKSPITVMPFGHGSAPTVQGAGTGEGTGAVELVDAAHWIVQGLHVTNSSGPGDTHRSGVLVINRTAGRLSGITLRDLTVDHVTSNPWVNGDYLPHQAGGISVITASPVIGAGFDGVDIMSNRVSRVGRSGIVIWNRQAPGSPTRDRRVRISRNHVAWTTGDGILMAGTDHGRIDGNVAAHASNLPTCSPVVCPDTRSTASVGIWPIFSRNLRIDHNEAYGTRWGPGDGEGFDIDSGTEKVVFEYNYAHDNAGGGLLLCGSKDVTVRFNIFQNNRKSALVFIGTVPAERTRIYNNTIYTSKATRARPVRFFNGAFPTDILFTNNLVYNYGLADWVWPSRPTTKSNTLIGRHRYGRPTDSRTSRVDPRLRMPGTGSIGRKSLDGYKPRRHDRSVRGTAIPADARVDFFGRAVDPRRPPRGAAG